MQGIVVEHESVYIAGYAVEFQVIRIEIPRFRICFVVVEVPVGHVVEAQHIGAEGADDFRTGARTLGLEILNEEIQVLSAVAPVDAEVDEAVGNGCLGEPHLSGCIAEIAQLRIEIADVKKGVFGTVADKDFFEVNGPVEFDFSCTDAHIHIPFAAQEGGEFSYGIHLHRPAFEEQGQRTTQHQECQQRQQEYFP